MRLWLRALLCIGSLFSFDVQAMDDMSIDISSIRVAPRIEHIFKAHCLSLASAASTYEQKHYSTVLTQLCKDMHHRRLVQLIQESKQCLREICEAGRVKQAFQQARQKTEAHVGIDERVVYWEAFIGLLYKKQAEIRKEKLPDVWFPTQQDTFHAKKFIERNAETTLESGQQNHLKESKVLTFLPFVLIAQYDNESFHAFLAARG